MADENADKAVAASENITDKKTVNAGNGIVDKTTDAVQKDNATQSFNVQKNNVNGISEKAVESNLIQDNGTQDSWADPSKYGFHKTNAGWTKLMQGNGYTSVAKKSTTTLINTDTGKELDKNQRYEIGFYPTFGFKIDATVDMHDIKQGNSILISSVPVLFKDNRVVAYGLFSANINVVSNGVKIGHIIANEDAWATNPAQSSEITYSLVIDQTQNMAQDLDLHIQVGRAGQYNQSGVDYEGLAGTTTSNPTINTMIANDSTKYGYTWYVNPNNKLKPYHSTDSNVFGLTDQDLSRGIIGIWDHVQDPNKSFTDTDVTINRVLKLSHPKEINGVSIPSFNGFTPRFQVRMLYPQIIDDEGNQLSDLWQETGFYNFQGVKLADNASVQQIADVAKDKHFVYSLSDDGQTMIVGINIRLGRKNLNKLTGENYSVNDAVKEATDRMHRDRTTIDYPDKVNDIIKRSTDWIKTHDGEPYKYNIIIDSLPADVTQPNIQTITDVTPNVKNPQSISNSLMPKNSDLHFDVSVFRNINVKYIDDDNHGATLGNDVFQTTTGTDLTYNIKPAGSAGFNSATDIAFPSNYILNQDATVHYGVVQDKNKDIEIHVKHLVKTVDGSSNLDLYPDIKKALNGDSTRTFHIIYPAGRQGSNPSTIVQSIHFIRSGKADFSTDTVDASTLTAWKPVASTAHGVIITNGVANFDSITLPRIAGYHAQVNTNKANPAMFLVSFVANSMPSTPTDNKDQNTSKDYPDITTPKTSDDKHETIPETPSAINDGQKPSQTKHDWTINSIKSDGYLVSNGVDNYSLPMIGKTGLSIIKTSSNTLAFAYIKLNTPSDYIFTLIKRHKMYQLTVNKMENGKLTAIKTFRSHNYKDLMKELKKMAF